MGAGGESFRWGISSAKHEVIDLNILSDRVVKLSAVSVAQLVVIEQYVLSILISYSSDTTDFVCMEPLSISNEVTMSSERLR